MKQPVVFYARLINLKHIKTFGIKLKTYEALKILKVKLQVAAINEKEEKSMLTSAKY
jgi:hypothetical protein